MADRLIEGWLLVQRMNRISQLFHNVRKIALRSCTRNGTVLHKQRVSNIASLPYSGINVNLKFWYKLIKAEDRPEDNLFDQLKLSIF